jgi:hypothetical protein
VGKKRLSRRGSKERAAAETWEELADRGDRYKRRAKTKAALRWRRFQNHNR